MSNAAIEQLGGRGFCVGKRVHCRSSRIVPSYTLERSEPHGFATFRDWRRRGERLAGRRLPRHNYLSTVYMWPLFNLQLMFQIAINPGSNGCHLSRTITNSGCALLAGVGQCIAAMHCCAGLSFAPSWYRTPLLRLPLDRRFYIQGPIVNRHLLTPITAHFVPPAFLFFAFVTRNRYYLVATMKVNFLSKLPFKGIK